MTPGESDQVAQLPASRLGCYIPSLARVAACEADTFESNGRKLTVCPSSFCRLPFSRFCIRRLSLGRGQLWGRQHACVWQPNCRLPGPPSMALDHHAAGVLQQHVQGGCTNHPLFNTLPINIRLDPSLAGCAGCDLHRPGGPQPAVPWLAHTRKSELPAAVIALQDRGVLVSRKMHGCPS
ncbi:hypothetical protein WJX84_009845 [Apatococcus fuscideae]|uniref:Uncharacterized protein n=1 Tax=Apatococcus fuscideae TaxID=2026836 RepID=A0AAW1SVK5_9CHLO